MTMQLWSRPGCDLGIGMRARNFAIYVSFTLMATPAFAAGYGLKEHSADAMAAAYAGAAATDRDATYLAYNPAALGGVESTDLSINLVGISPGSRANYTTALTAAGTPAGGAPGDSGFISDALVPAFAVRHRLSDHWIVGLDVTAPWGLRTYYPITWAGRYYGLKSKLLTINATPSIAYQLTPNLTVGAGMQIEYAIGELTSAIDTGTIGFGAGVPGSVPGAQDSFARLTGKSWAYGYNVGVQWSPTSNLHLGVAYRSSIKHDLKGPLTFTLDSAGTGATIRALTGLFTNTTQTTALSVPDVLTSGLKMDFSEQWSGMLEFDWTGWDRFRELRVVAANPAQPNDVTTTRWENTMFGSVGFEYRPNSRWAIRAGAAYDQSPVPDATREPRIPDADRIWLSAGVRFAVNRNMDLNITASRLFFLKTDVALTPALLGGALRGTLIGTTESYANVAGLQFTWRPN